MYEEHKPDVALGWKGLDDARVVGVVVGGSIETFGAAVMKQNLVKSGPVTAAGDTLNTGALNI